MEQLPTPELIKFTGRLSHENAERLKTISVLNDKSLSENVRIAVAIYEVINEATTNGQILKVEIDDELYDLEPYQQTDELDKPVPLTVNMNIPTHTALLSHQEDEKASPEMTLNSAIGQYAQLFEHDFSGEPVYIYYPDTNTRAQLKLINTA